MPDDAITPATEPGYDPLPADPIRGLTPEQIADAGAALPDGDFYDFGMHTAVGAARVAAMTDAVAATLDAGLGRDVALATLLGGCLRLERDGHNEYSDTVVRDSIAAALEPACDHAGVDPFTDDEIAEASLLVALRCLDAYGSGWLKGATEQPTKRT